MNTLSARPLIGPGEQEVRVVFFIPGEADIDEIETWDPDRDWSKMRRKQRWVLQTALRLKNAGFPVDVSSRVPTHGLVVYHARHGKELQRQLNGKGRPHLVGIRGDNRESLMADFEIVQNGRFHDDSRRFFIPYWPQPGLVPRRIDRGKRIERVAFKGFEHNLHPYFKGDDWLRWCADHDIDWVCDTVSWDRSEEVGVGASWQDYSDIDAIVAMRPDPTRPHERRGHTSKPASKLINAWIAGVPAVLGMEFAFREAGDPPNDYLEISRPEQAREAILSLRRNPERVRRIVTNGRKQTERYQHPAIVEAWSNLLFERIPGLVGLNGLRWGSGRWLAVRTFGRGIIRFARRTPAR